MGVINLFIRNISVFGSYKKITKYSTLYR